MSDNFNFDLSEDKVFDILLAEDSEPDVKITLRAFKSARLKNNIFVVNDGQECLDFVRQEGVYADKGKCPRPDLILLDMNMPKIDGLGVLKVLKQDPAYRAIPIIVLTGSRNEEDIRKSYENGANSFIQKPVAYEDFVKLIESFNLYWHIIAKLPRERK